MRKRGFSAVVWATLFGAPALVADQFEITAGIAGPANHLCATDCKDAPNFLSRSDVGLYLSGHKAATEELLVFLVPDNIANPLASIGSVKVYDAGASFSFTGALGTAVPAAPTNAGTVFGLGSGSLQYVSGGFWGTVDSDEASVKVGKLLGIGLGGSINMDTVAEASQLFSASKTDEFGVYTLLVTAAFGGGQLVDLQFPTLLPEGTFIAGVTDTGLATTSSSAGVIDEPNVQAAVPEPTSIVLLASIALGLGVRGRFATRG